MRLILVRHAQSTSNLRGVIDTASPGPALTDLGRGQADNLIPTMIRLAPQVLFVSGLTRTMQTATPTARRLGLTPVVHAGLREVGGGELEGRVDLEAKQVYLSTILAWSTGAERARLPGGETGAEVYARFDAAVAAAAREADVAALFSHGAVIRTWVDARALALPADFVATHIVPNCGVVELEGEPGASWRLCTWPPEGVRASVRSATGVLTEQSPTDSEGVRSADKARS
jgi:broad specificity phosphatase PhoE